MVHDAVRACLTQQEIEALVSEVAEDKNGGLLALPVRDTMKRQSVDKSIARVAKTINRENLWHALTPQYFHAASLKTALEKGNGNLVLDLDTVTLMDSIILGVVAGVFRELPEHGHLVLCTVGDNVASLLRLTHLDRILASYGTREEAYFKAMAVIEKGENHGHDRVNPELQAVFEEEELLGADN